MRDIGTSVGVKDGVPCYNHPNDQGTVMDLLEKIDVSRGGLRGDPGWKRPAPAGLRWKDCPGPLRAAILRFQTAHRAELPYPPDGHVDPGGATIRLMNALLPTIQTIRSVTIEAVPWAARDPKRPKIELEIHDRRIEGAGMPGRRVRYVDSRFPIETVLSYINAEVRAGFQISRLILVAHGWYVGGDDDAHPLFGVMLGRDGIHPGFESFIEWRDPVHGFLVAMPGVHSDTYSLFGRFKGRIDEIRFYACGAASRVWFPVPGQANMGMSGYEMCGRLAVVSGAYVMAAELHQGYHYTWDIGPRRTVDPSFDAPRAQGDRPDRAYTLGAPTVWDHWHGPVWVFSPFNGKAIAGTAGGIDPYYEPEWNLP